MSTLGPKQALFAQFAAIAKTLGHAHRLELLEQLAQGERSVEILALAPRSDKAAAPHVLQMLRGIGNRQASSIGKNLNAALTLSKLLQQLKAMGMPQRFRDRSELGKQCLFGTEG